MKRLFDDLGKERSLFFVQSLACIGRTRQLDGNQYLKIADKLYRPTLTDVSVLAAALACIREQDKIEDLAQPLFTPDRQLDLVTVYALMASAESSLANQYRTPKEIAQTIFDVDPVNQNEEYTAILRQMQKHALLFAAAGEGLRAGDWRPQFLSDWVRCALLVRAWRRRATLNKWVKRDLLVKTVVRAERARITFESLLPKLLASEEGEGLDELVSRLSEEMSDQSPEAAGNYWALVAGFGSREHIALPAGRMGLVPLADLSNLAFEGVGFDSTFSGTLSIMANIDAIGCTFTGCHLASCDLVGAVFTGARFENVTFEYCDGPISFDDCTFVDCRFVDGCGPMLPIYRFSGCEFDEGTRIEQNRLASPKAFGPIASFADCVVIGDAEEIVLGGMAGYTRLPPEGLVPAEELEGIAPDELCLRALLKPFFPRRAGEGGDLQARRYIRSSAIGRGVFPVGAPAGPDLAEVLSAFGFTDGGRQGHVYAPWSPVVGGGQDAIALRNEILAFLHSGERGRAVDEMLARIRGLAGWE